MASFGERTCEVCGGLDGQRFKLTDIQYGVNFPPVHPNCRCTTVGWDEADEAAELESAEQEALTYDEWYAKYVEGRESVQIAEHQTAPALIAPTVDGRSNITVFDVTDEYLRSATPGQGSITFDIAYSKSKHRDEIKMADWLLSNFGGSIKLLNESSIKNQTMPDYLWNNKHWELKGAHSVNSADKLLQHAIKQIQNNPGGVILNTLEDIDIAALETQLIRRIERSKINEMDLMLLSNSRLVKILRYKK